MSEQFLISISEASNLLGISEVTLRQWTDEGKIKAFITPGGHRRYSKEDLKKFMNSSQKVLGVRDLVIGLEESIHLHREIDKANISSTSWYNELDQQSQKHLAELGRHILDLIIRYINEPSKREELIKLARNAGRDFGEVLAKSGLPLTDSVEAFILHREPLMKVTTHLMRKRGALNRRVVESIPMVTQVMDEALMSLVAAHQQYRTSLKSNSEGNISE